MAKAVEEGAKTAKGLAIFLNYRATPLQLRDADAVIIGVPTYNHHMTLDIQSLLEKAAAAEVILEDKPAAAFGSYGWSGEAPKEVLEILQNRFKMRIIEPVVLAKYKPDQKALEDCRELGKKVAEAVL